MVGNVTKVSSKYFEWIKGTFKFNEDFIKSYNGETVEGDFLQVDVNYLEKLSKLHFYLKEWRLKMLKSL